MKSVKVMGWNDQGIETFDVVGIEDHSITRSDFDLIEIALGDMDCSKLNEMEWYEIVLEPKWEDDGSGQKCLDWYEIKTVKVYDSNTKTPNNPPAFSNVILSRLKEEIEKYKAEPSDSVFPVQTIIRTLKELKNKMYNYGDDGVSMSDKDKMKCLL